MHDLLFNKLTPSISNLDPVSPFSTKPTLVNFIVYKRQGKQRIRSHSICFPWFQSSWANHIFMSQPNSNRSLLSLGSSHVTHTTILILHQKRWNSLGILAFWINSPPILGDQKWFETLRQTLIWCSVNPLSLDMTLAEVRWLTLPYHTTCPNSTDVIWT